MSSGLLILWLIAIVPGAWLFWSRGGLPGPSFRFPRDPLSGSFFSLIPDGKCLLFAAAIACWAVALVLSDPVEQRASTLFLIDNSASMADPSLDSEAKITTKLKLGTGVLSDLAASAGAFAKVDPGRTGLVRFSAMPRVLQPLTDESRAVALAIAQLEPEKTPLDAETNLVDGLIEALVRVNAVPSSRRTIVLWTDGEANVRDTASGWSLSQAAIAIRALGVKLIVADAGPEELDPGDPGYAQRVQAKRLLARLVSDADGIALTRLEAAGLLEHFPGKTAAFKRLGMRLVLCLAGLILSLGGLLLYWRAGDLKRFLPRDSALSRSVFWPPGARGYYRRFGLLALAAWFAALAATTMLYFGWSRAGESLALFFDARPSMLAGQPSRMELGRRYLDRALLTESVRTRAARPIEAWVMTAKPVRIFAPTWDFGAVRDEWDRLETWAEDASLFAATPQESISSPFHGPVLWVSDGTNPTPAALAGARTIGGLEAIGTPSARLERGGQSWDFVASQVELRRSAGWGKRFSLQDPPAELGTCMAGTPLFAGPADRILLALSLGFFVLTMLPQVVRASTMSATNPVAIPQAAALASALLFSFLCGQAIAQGPTDKEPLPEGARIALEKARQSLVRISQTPLAERIALLDEVLKDLDRAEKLGGAGDPQAKLMRFLALAHKRDLMHKASLPPEMGEGQDNTPSQSSNSEEKDTQSGKKMMPFEGSLPKGELPTKKGDSVPGGLIGPGETPVRELGLYDQLLLAQRKIAAESTTRRLSRIIPREWNPGEWPQ